jgi:hypothetical protein
VGREGFHGEAQTKRSIKNEARTQRIGQSRRAGLEGGAGRPGALD